jgi:hypothetical protein
MTTPNDRSVAYSPSWVNHLATWVDRLPGSSGHYYLGLWLVLVSALLASLWIEGVYPVGTIFPAQIFIPAMISLFLAAIPFLDDRAGAALATLHPALEATEDEYALLRHRLTTLPSWPTLLASLVTVAFILLLGLISGQRDASIEALADSPTAANLLFATYWIGWWVMGAFVYHTIHQLRAINHIYTKHTRVSLYATSPLYAFSGVTAPTAAILAVATYGWTALNPGNLSDPISIVVICLITILALGAFAWPLLGTRRLMASQKMQKLDQVSLRLEAVFAELHQRLDDGEVDDVDDLTNAIALLETERETLNVVSTWPWQPETARWLVTALVLPLLLWIFQYILQLVLGS